MKRTNLVVLFSFMLLLSSYSLKSLLPSVTLEGTVVSAQTGKPLSNVHVYTVDGEEEALTNNKGEFRIETWKKLPVQLTVEHKDYETTRVTVSDGSRRQVIRLRAR